jgi:hypothetical protein
MWSNLSTAVSVSTGRTEGGDQVSSFNIISSSGYGCMLFFYFIHPRWCILSIINNLSIIVIHSTCNNLLFRDFYDDMFRSLNDHLQVVSSNFGYSQPCFAVTYSYHLVYVLILKSYKMFKTIYNM